jgi:hypothetical protein
VFTRVRVDEFVVLRGLQQRLRRNTSDIYAGAAEGLVLLDADGGEAELCGANGGHVSTWPAANNNDIGVHANEK